MGVAGQRIVVTGASAGIGRETARLLASRGATVVAAARDEARLRQLEDEQPGIVPFACDLSNESDRAALAATAAPVDVLVNNAGVGWRAMVEDLPPEKARQIIEVNVLALVDLTQRVLPSMLERGSGHIVNVGSIAGFVAAPRSVVYCASKFAVQGFTDGLRREVAGRGVDVTLIAPGPIRTEFATRAAGGPPGVTDARGLPPELVARAILRAIEHPRRLGYQTISVPRVAGLSRLGAWPGMARVADLALRVLERPLADRGARVAEGGSQK